jgi:hypothetical protein
MAQAGKKLACDVRMYETDIKVGYCSLNHVESAWN